MVPPSWRLAGALVSVVLAASAFAQSDNSTQSSLTVHWEELLQADATRAYRAMRQMAQTPRQTIAFLREALAPVPVVKGEVIEQLIGRLSRERFQDRDQAQKELEKHDWQARAALLKAARGDLDLEKKRRVTHILARLAEPLSGTPLRWHRAVEVVEWIGGPEAKELLERWGQGAGDARLTQEANKALARWRPGIEPTLIAPGPRVDALGDPLPAGVTLRLGSTRWRSGGAENTRVRSILYTPDGKRLVVIGDSSIIMVDAQDGKALFQEELTGSIANALFSPDGKRLVASGYFYGNNGRSFGLHLWDQKDFKKTSQWNVDGIIRGFGQTSNIALLETPNGIQQFDLEASREISLHAFPDGARASQAINGKTAVVRTASDNHVLVYDWSSPEKIKSLEIPGRYSLGLAISPDSKVLAWADYDNGVLLFDLTTGEMTRHLAPAGGTRPYVRTMVFSPDGKALAFTDGINKTSVVVWDMESNKVRWKSEQRVDRLVFSPDSRRIAAGGDVRIHVWDAFTGKEVTTRDIASSPSRDMGFAPDGRGLWSLNAEQLSLWDFPSGKLRNLFPHADARTAAMSPDGRFIATASMTPKVSIWDAASARELFELPGPYPYLGGLGFSSDNKRILTWGEDLIVRSWDRGNGRLLGEHALRPEGLPKVDEDEDGPRRRRLRYPTPYASALSGDGSRLIWYFNRLRLYDTVTGNEAAVFDDSTRFRHYGIKTSADMEWLVVAGYGSGQPTTVYNLQQGLRFGTVELQHATTGNAAISTDGRCFAVATNRPDRKIYLYETATLKPRLTLAPEHGIPTLLAFDPDARYLVAAISDGTLLAWDLRNQP